MPSASHQSGHARLDADSTNNQIRALVEANELSADVYEQLLIQWAAAAPADYIPAA
ncbi:hypothetical protein [Streptomyces beijiangensis]|uniref:Uncharacterized protein n=1 Tax=Streptomyces beijiangensis TaxID=163361 RepID=A0A939JI94_9ACTN|nr:hypothetical protein [Streptomyces beijiangensis]MBO0515283.1 hypothetical protein [Streptomyces beijiangensis]